MDDLTDTELLAEFARSGSNPAFAALVKRHVNLVYSVARRASGDPHHAEEITQSVFLILARKAGSLSPRVVLSGWLYQTARLTAANHRRDELRRRRREQDAAMQSPDNESDLEAWKQLAPLLDDAMDSLGRADRDALVLRYFENRTAAQIATKLRTTEAAAHKRVVRALEKLRRVLSRRGVTLAGTLIASAVAANSVQAAPAALASASVAAATGQAMISAPMGALVEGTLRSIAWLKIKFAAGAGVAVLAAGMVAIVLFAHPDGEPPANPEIVREILGAAFERVSGPIPARMRFVAEVETEQRAWTEAEIRAEARKIQDDTRGRTGQAGANLATLPRAERERLQAEQAEVLRLQEEAVRWAHQPKRTLVAREWVAGSNWRLDRLDTSPTSEALKAATRDLPDGVVYETTYFGCNDTDWSPSMPYLIDHRLRSAWFGRSNWKAEAFAEATNLEPPVAFLLSVLLGDTSDLGRWVTARAQSGRIRDSFSGLTLSTNQLESLALGLDRRWSVRTGTTNLDGRKLVFVQLKGKGFSLLRGSDATFYADAANRRHLHRVEVASLSLLKTPYVSIRDDFNDDGFPRTWIVETPNDSEMLKRSVRFKEVEIPAQFDDREIRSPEIPGGYQVIGRAP